MMIATYPVEDMGKKIAEQALDEYLINGKSLREWISILSSELTMLDKIRAEIEEQKQTRCFDDDDMFAYKTGLEDAIWIIDKYIAESEVKE